MKAIINGINMAWDDNGSGPAVCLIHGFPLDRRMWRPQIGPLVAAGYRVITPDLRGFGESDAPEEAYSMELFSDDVAALLEHVGIGRAVIGGMSMGGYVLFSILERHPALAAAACFICTRSGADDAAGRERRSSLANAVLSSGARVAADSFVDVLFADETAKSQPHLVAEVYGRMTVNRPTGVAGGLLAMRERKDFTPLLGSFQMPSLVIGADGDRAAPVENARALAAGLPNGTLRVIGGAGHMANLEKPEEFNECLLGFLRSLPPC